MKLYRLSQVILAILIAVGLIGSPPQAIRASAENPPASAAHYIVFEKPSGEAIRPVFYRAVTLAAPLQSLTAAQVSEALAQSSRNTDSLVVLLHTLQGEIVYRDVVNISPWLRGEFHGATPGAPIDGHLFPQETITFVVRIPAIAGTRLTLQDANYQSAGDFDLAELARQTPEIDLSSSSVTSNDSTLNGPPANRVDFLIMGDGYTSAQSAQFTTDANNIATQFFGISPLAEYQNYVNVHTLFTASTQSGSDHPPYQSGCTAGAPTCCGDSAAASDPLQGTYADTAFDSTFCYYNIHRLLVSNSAKVLAAAAAVPDWDTIMVIVNDPVYGGSGGYIATVSMHSAAAQIAQHEYGHSFIDLADEYESPYPGYPACSDLPGSTSPCEANVTDITTREQIKWYPWILPSTPIPTPNSSTYNGLVGLFQGARYLSVGMYRPGYLCIMRSLGVPFCQVPSQAYVLKLYNGGWGVPASGISPIEPGSATPATPVNLTHPAAQAFHADLLGPVGGPPLQITWLIDGVPVPSANGDTFTYTTSTAGTFVITLQVKDATTLVNPAMGGSALEDSHSWTVNVAAFQEMMLEANPTALTADGSSTSAITATVTNGGTPVVGETVTFATDLGEVNPLMGVTNANGVAVTTLTASTNLGTATITASTDEANASTHVEFVAGPPASLVVNAAPGMLPANGVSQSSVSALVTDAYQHPLSGVTITFTGTLGSLLPLSGVTDASGQATTVFTAGTISGTAVITATAPSLSAETNIILLNVLHKTYLPLMRK